MPCRTHRLQRLHLWLALVAMLAMALLPSVSHALAFARGNAGSWAEVCTPQGMRLMQVDAAQTRGTAAPGDSAPPLHAAGFLEHCALCALAADAPALPAATPLALLLPQGSHALPRLFLHGPHTLHAWRSAQPRGPPAAA